STPGSGVTLEDCALVSRALEAYFEGRGDIAERYVLEVSSPGVVRPLVRPRDFERSRREGVALLANSRIEAAVKRVARALLGREPSSVSGASASRSSQRAVSRPEGSVSKGSCSAETRIPAASACRLTVRASFRYIATR